MHCMFYIQCTEECIVSYNIYKSKDQALLCEILDTNYYQVGEQLIKSYPIGEYLIKQRMPAPRKSVA